MILIVDDNTDNIFSLKRLLELKDFKVDSAQSGEEALKKVLKTDYSLIILDVQMPGLDGFEVAEALAGYSKTKDIPIIFLSAVNTEKRFITKGYASGGLDYVTKPVDPDILLLKVKTFIRLQEQTQSLYQTQKALRIEIEARKEAQRTLNERIDYLNALLEALPQIAFKLDPTGQHINFVNKKWFQYSEDKHHFPQTEEKELSVQQIIDRQIAERVTHHCEVRILERDTQEYKYHLFYFAPIFEKDELVNWVGTFTDIQAQKNMEKEKDAFLSITSHELKTPLTGIKAYLQLLQRKLAGKDSMIENTYLSKVNHQVDKLNSIITDLLDISKIENGKLTVNLCPFEIEKMISNVIETIRQTHENTKIKIIRKGNLDGVMVEGDEIRIEQVLINFLTNAIKYAPNTEEVIVSSKLEDNFVQINVLDQGIGIVKEKLPHVFKKFYRVEESSVKFQGLGLGLYICSEIIRQHHGTVGVESEINKGSDFYFKIPLKQDNYAQ